jgi:hypothetical protein
MTFKGSVIVVDDSTVPATGTTVELIVVVDYAPVFMSVMTVVEVDHVTVPE